jgi:hypothetical protein
LGSDNGRRHEGSKAGGGALGDGFNTTGKSSPAIFGTASTEQLIKDFSFLKEMS